MPSLSPTILEPPVAAPLPEECIHRLFEAQAARTPQAIAVVWEGRTLSYAALNAAANRLARHLRARGIGPGALVGVCLDSSPAMLVALLAVLKAGGAYLPLDPDYPPDRLAFLLRDSQAPLLITQEPLRDRLPAGATGVLCLDTDREAISGYEGDNLEGGAGPDDLAYVIYTSGSTGTPKGVMIAHRGVAANLRWRQDAFPLTAGDRLLQTYSFSFDPSVWALFWPLTVGAALVLPRPGGIADSAYLVEMMAGQGITVMGAGPALWRALLAEPGIEKCRSLRHAFCGGEPLTGDLRGRFLAQLPRTALHNVYGPTEATIDATWWTCPRPDTGEAATPIGHPLPTASAWLLGEDGRPVSDGAAGELCLGGVGLARGYLRRPELTDQRFIPHPVDPAPGARLYRTGDLARRRPDGALEYLGRLDDQVKVRGYRIELGEIETALARLPGVRMAAVAAREDTPGDRRLAAYVVPEGTAPPVPVLRRALRQALPAYMVPSAWVFLDALPLSPNGKVDRHTLPAPRTTDRERGDDYAPPRNTLEQRLAGIWEELLDTRPLGVHDHFFEIGGHSLLAARLLARVRREWGAEITLRGLFETPTIALLAERLRAKGVAHTDAGPASIPPTPRTEALPLSFAQESLWLVSRLEPDSPVYNIPLCLRLAGPLDARALEHSLSEIVRRHEALRTCVTLAPNGRPVQTIRAPEALPLETVDLSGLPPDTRGAEAQSYAEREARRPFDLAADQMLRAVLLRLGREEYRLLLTLHHIACDGWSVGILMHELTALYAAFAAGLPSPLPELPMQYADYAAWQRQRLTGPLAETQLAYWTRQLADATPLALPTDRPRPPVGRFEGARLPVALPRALVDRLHDLGRQEDATLFMTLTAAFQGLLARHTGQADIVIGSPVAGRNAAETESLIGHFINPLVLRTFLGGNPSAREMLRRVREVTLDAQAHQDLPFERIVEALQPERDAGRNPLFSVMLVLQTPPAPGREMAGLTMTIEETETGTAKMDLLLSLTDGPDGLSGWWDYSTDLYDRATMERLSAHFRCLLEGMAAAPDRTLSALPLLPEAERHQVLNAFQRADPPIAARQTVHALVEAQAARGPDAVALAWHDGQMTYAEMNRRANQLAHVLQERGVGPGERVGVCLERSPELIIALLGVLKAGGAYLPLDPDYPPDRLAFLLADSQPALLLTQASLAPRLPEHMGLTICLEQEQTGIARRSGANPASGTDADSLAYVMYTSGSTGQPKGVLIPHRGVVRLVQDADYADITPDDVFLQLSPVSFDASTFEIWGSLANGARLALAPARTPSLEELGRTLRRHGVTTLWLTAGLFSLMAEERLDDLRPLRQLLAGGDVLPLPHVQKMLQALPGCRLINGYGPTESTTFTCCHPITADSLRGGSVPIGRPIRRTEVYVLDADRQPAPIGVPGELYIGGDALALGYLNRPDLTAEKFVPHPFSPDPTARLYRSGDVARWRPDGVLEFLGRRDMQVKVRGYRIELGEIETALARHPAVRDAVALAHGEAHEKQIVAYLVPEPGQSVSPAGLRQSLQETLPGYMIPSRFVLLETLPLTPNGKVDRAALREPPPEPTSARPALTPPRTPLETALCGLWAEALGVPQVGVRDNFFEIGGHSLLAALLLHRIERLCGRKLPLATLFAHATVEDLARVLRQPASGAQSPLVRLHADGSRRPLFFLHGDFQGGFYCLNMARHLGPDQPLCALPPHGMDGGTIPDTIEEMAADYGRVIRAAQPEGPYRLGGFCNGGLVAYEIARQLRAQGQEVEALLLLDMIGINTRFKRTLHRLTQDIGRIARISPDARRQAFIRTQECLMPLGLLLKRLRDLVMDAYYRAGDRFFPEQMARMACPVPLVEQETQMVTLPAYYHVLGRYILRPYDGPLTLLWAQQEWDQRGEDLMLGWRDVAPQAQVVRVPGGHLTCLTDHIQALAETLARVLGAAPE